jgi:hypothetical protein
MTTLQFLYNFIQSSNNRDLLNNNNLHPNSILGYYEVTNKSFSQGYFYLGGQIKLKPNDIISENIIKQIQQKILNRNESDYANSFEKYSCMDHDISFNHCVDIINFLKLNNLC